MARNLMSLIFHADNFSKAQVCTCGKMQGVFELNSSRFKLDLLFLAILVPTVIFLLIEEPFSFATWGFGPMAALAIVVFQLLGFSVLSIMFIVQGHEFLCSARRASLEMSGFAKRK